MEEQKKYVRRDITIKRLSAVYIERKRGKVKPSTLECYRRNIKCHILPEMGGYSVADLTAEEINDYVGRLMEDYSPKLVREIVTLLLAILRIAGINFTRQVALPKVRQKTIEVFTEPELKQLGQVILDRPDEMGMGVLLAAYTGIRLGELCGLQWRDVNAETGMIHIQRTVGRIAQANGGTVLMIQPPKTENSNRWVPVPQELLVVLDANHRRPEQYLLTSSETALDPRTCQNRYRALLEHCGVCYRSFHSLRHTYATRCIERGVDAKSVSEMLGHSDVRTTLRLYVHSSMDYKRKAVERIGFLGEESLKLLQRHFVITLDGVGGAIEVRKS